MIIYVHRSGPGAAVNAGQCKGDVELRISHVSLVRQSFRYPLLGIIFYFIAAYGVSSSFSPSFTFESYDETVTFSTPLNSITDALSRIPEGPALLDVSHILSLHLLYRH